MKTRLIDGFFVYGMVGRFGYYEKIFIQRFIGGD